eukprot:TRINITY_DN556_c0_g1_i4.p1 TRINITY_DN556_c0_g1~~TRINITY_DN556_c0_g1_i4.p1  ORF type:complete len:188 (+),score=12.38 TRINITY_DN556_c0_g1_i4:1408-1971(+)
MMAALLLAHLFLVRADSPCPSLPFSLDEDPAATGALERILPPSPSYIAESPASAPKSQENKCTNSSASLILTQIADEFRCCICQELMVEAHALACAHTFCRPCVAEWLLKAVAAGKPQTCPTCRTPVSLPPTPVRALDNAIDKVAEVLLTADEREERTQRTTGIDVPLGQALEAAMPASAEDTKWAY